MTHFRILIFIFWLVFFSPVFCRAQVIMYHEGFYFRPNPVTGIPFSSEQETEETTKAIDGGRSVQKKQARMCRDSAGRMRYETFAPAGGNPGQDTPEWIMIVDLKSETTCTLRPSTHIASCLTVPLPSMAPEPAPFPPPEHPDNVDRYVTGIRASYAQTQSKDLGTKMMAGVPAKGERTTWSLPPGAQGIDRPAVESEEFWIATGLEIVMFSREANSQGSDKATRIVSLDRSEPDPALFQVPQDYTRRDVPLPSQ
jgi:hypothetical protein